MNTDKYNSYHQTEDDSISIPALILRVMDFIPLMVVVAVILGLVAGKWAETQVAVRYVAASEVYVIMNETQEGQRLVSSDIQMAELLKADFADAITSRIVHQRVIDELDLPYATEILSGMVTASYNEESRIIQIQVVADSEEEAIRLANAYAVESDDYIKEQLNVDMAIIWEEAVRAYPRQTIQPAAYFRYGVLGGVAITLVTVILMVVFDGKVRTPEDVGQRLGVPFLGSAALLSGRSRRTNQEALNVICSNVAFLCRDKKVLAVASPAENDGKTYLTMEMARYFAESGKKVVVVDGNLRCPALHLQHGVVKKQDDADLIGYLNEKYPLSDVLWQTRMKRIWFVGASERVDNPIPLLLSQRFDGLLTQLGKVFDLVLVDTPGAERYIDAAVVAHHCDGVILLARYAGSRKYALSEMIAQMEKTQVPVLGCMINKVKFTSLLAWFRFRALRAGIRKK